MAMDKDRRTNLCRWCGVPLRMVFLPSWVVEETGERTLQWLHQEATSPEDALWCTGSLHSAAPTLWADAEDDS